MLLGFIAVAEGNQTYDSRNNSAFFADTAASVLAANGIKVYQPLKMKDGTALENDTNVPYGTMPEYTGKTPTRPSTAQYNYNFDAWSPEVVSVTTDADYTANFTSVIRQYTVTFLDWDGTELSKQLLDYATPATAPADPTREGYTFKGWDKDFSNVQSDLTVTALYEQNAVEPPIPDEAITVRLDPKSCSSWSTVYLYAWEGAALGGWPGMEWKTKDAEGWLYHVFDSNVREVNILFNNVFYSYTFT